MRRVHARDDRGATLVELLVGMGIMLVFLGIFSGTMTMMSRSESKTRWTADTANQVELAFNWLDKNVRYAAAVSTPGTGPGGWYVELLRTTASGTNCAQVQLSTAGTLSWRTWQPPATPTATWTQIATGFTNGTAASGSVNQPFVLGTAATSLQQLKISLTASAGPGSQPTTTNSTFAFTALNSSGASTSACQVTRP